jgi:dTDP-glucose 4,6-dehydratase
VNPVGPRGVYDEAKRYAEALTMAYRRTHGVNTGIARIFNTYGERMRPQDGRAIPAFVTQALRGIPLTIAGDGSQTRSVQYVSDLVEGVTRFAASDHPGPMNLGNPDELTVREIATRIRELVGSSSELTTIPKPEDDPMVRRPDIGLATKVLDWEPKVTFDEGIARTITWFRTVLAADGSEEEIRRLEERPVDPEWGVEESARSGRSQ